MNSACTDSADINREIGCRLRDIREKKGYTREALAWEAETSLDTIKRIENGSAGRADILFKISITLGIPVQDLFPPQKESSKNRIENVIDLLQKVSELGITL